MGLRVFDFAYINEGFDKQVFVFEFDSIDSFEDRDFGSVLTDHSPAGVIDGFAMVGYGAVAQGIGADYLVADFADEFVIFIAGHIKCRGISVFNLVVPGVYYYDSCR